jgi:branched-chain amino acid transport system permease protein
MIFGWLGAAVAAGGASAFVGGLTLRLRADYLAITTFGVAVVVQLVALNAQRLTGGAFGIAFIPRPFETLASTPVLYDLANLALVAAVVLALYVALERLARSPWGRVLRAIREDERAAMALGKSPTRYRLQAFALGGALMGLAGAMEAHFIGFIAPESYLSSLTFQVWAMLIVGGIRQQSRRVARRGGRLGAVDRFRPRHQRRGSSLLRSARGGAAPRGDRRPAGDDDRLASRRTDRRTRARVAPRRRRRMETRDER